MQPDKTADILRPNQQFPREMTPEKRAAVVGSAPDWLKQMCNQSEALSRSG